MSLSFGDLCTRTNLLPHRVRYFLGTQRITPQGVLSGRFIYDEGAVALILAAARAAEQGRLGLLAIPKPLGIQATGGGQ